MVVTQRGHITLQALIAKVRGLLDPIKHPKTAEALETLESAVTSWADLIARFVFVLSLIFLNFLLAAISRPPQPYFSYII